MITREQIIALAEEVKANNDMFGDFSVALYAIAFEAGRVAETTRLEIALRIKTEEHKCCSEDLMKLRESEQSGWKEAAIAWEVCRSIHEAFAKKKDALYSTRHSDFERHAEGARRMLSTKAKEKVE